MTRNPFRYAIEQHLRPSPPAARTQGAKTWHGWCLVFVTEALGVGCRYDDAREAWEKAERKHLETDPTKVPRAVAAVFRTGDHWHIVLTRGGDSCWTTDYVRDGHVDVAKISDIARDWGPLVGWLEDVNGVRIYTPPPPKPQPKPAPKPAPKPPRTERGPYVNGAQRMIQKALAARSNKDNPRKLHALAKAAAWLKSIK